LAYLNKRIQGELSVADPGFDLKGGVDFVNGGEGGGGRIIESVEG